MRRKTLLSIFIPIGFLVIIIFVMQLFTNSIMREIESAFYCPDFYVEESRYDPTGNPDRYAVQDINYIIYQHDSEQPNIHARYNITRHSEETIHLDKVNINLKLYRIFTWHNFIKGTLWFKYTVIVTDKNDVTIFGGYDIPVRLTIERINGRWNVTSLYESP